MCAAGAPGSSAPGHSMVTALLTVAIVWSVSCAWGCGGQSTKPPEPKEPICEVIPDTLDFGRVEQGSMAEQSFRVTNIGTAGLQASIHLACDRFRIVEGGGDTTIAPGETLSVRVEYAPESRDEARCSVELDSIACGVVELVGNGFRTWHVHADGSGDVPTVQAGIDSSRDGDVVVVGPGTYYENINLRGRAIHLVSEAGPESTVLDGSHGDNTVVQCDSGETNDTIIEGLTVTNGSGWMPPWDVYSRLGGGVNCLGATPTLRNDIVRGNHALDTPPGGNSRGGGISIVSIGATQPVIVEGCIIQDNYCTPNAGGINIAGPCIIQNNVIRQNSTGTADGGGLYLIGTVGQVIITRNMILNNHAADHGGGIYIANTDFAHPELVEISRNVLIGNTALGSDAPTYCAGAGIWIIGGAEVDHNTLAFNVAQTTGPGLSGGGCCLLATARGTIVSYNVFYKNSEGGIVTDDRSTAQLIRNLLFANEVKDIEILGTPPIAQEGNLFQDPLFCDTTLASNGELAVDSPALSQPYGVIGAVAEPGCSAPPARPSVWAQARRRE